MVRISPEQFREAFSAAVDECRARGDNVFGGSYRESTKAIFERLFPATAEKLGLNCYQSTLFYIDCVFYAELDKINFPNGNYPKYIAVAVEHENNSSRSQEEMWKLQLYNAPLKVLIIYETEKRTEDLLRKFAGIIEAADIFGDISTLKRQLVVVGTPNAAENWRYNVYEEKGFRSI